MKIINFNIKNRILVKQKYKAFGYFGYWFSWFLIWNMLLFLIIGIINTLIGTYYFEEPNEKWIFSGIIVFVLGLLLNLILSLNSQKIRKNLNLLIKNGFKQKRIVIKKVKTYIYLKEEEKEYIFRDALKIIQEKIIKQKEKKLQESEKKNE